MANPGSIAARVPYGTDAAVRRRQDLEKALQQQAAARSLESSSIGKGGLRVKDGGSIIVEAGGDISLESGDFDANNVTAASTVAAGTVTAVGNVTAGGDVSGNHVNAASGHITGALTADGAVKMASVYTTQITTAFRVVYNGNGDGSMGYNLSSRRFKQDIEDYTIPPALLRLLRIVTFRYIAAVEKLGDEAATEVGLIAEEVDELGLTWLIDYDDEGRPEGLKFDRLAVAALALAQDVDERLTTLETKVG